MRASNWVGERNDLEACVAKIRAALSNRGELKDAR
jgi:hypothetical protein